MGRPRREGVDGAVVDVVLKALVRDGYAGLRIDDVAAEAGVAKTTVYRRWPTKEALVAEAVSRLYLDRVQPVDHGDLRADLVTLLRDTCEVLFRGSGRVLEDLVRESGRGRGRDHGLAAVVRATNEARRRAFHLAMNRAVARGELDVATDHELLVDLLVGPLWTRLLVTGSVVVEDDVEAIVDAVLDGVLAGPGD